MTYTAKWSESVRSLWKNVRKIAISAQTDSSEWIKLMVETFFSKSEHGEWLRKNSENDIPNSFPWEQSVDFMPLFQQLFRRPTVFARFLLYFGCIYSGSCRFDRKKNSLWLQLRFVPKDNKRNCVKMSRIVAFFKSTHSHSKNTIIFSFGICQRFFLPDDSTESVFLYTTYDWSVNVKLNISHSLPLAASRRYLNANLVDSFISARNRLQ